MSECIILERPDHLVSRDDIDPDALKVLYRLTEANHTAYLVGGGVRDLLLKRKPKDFDVSTSATPSEVRRLFRNCFLIGRRFRLAHIKYGTNIIETSTFRSQPAPQSEDEARDEPQNASLLQRNDNTFGTPEEDARRRDFTVNGLFYDIATFRVIDFVGGLEDLDKKLIRCLGAPNIRFQEDPVRMIRAVRFASRLGFTIEAKTFAAIQEHAEEIKKSALPRVLEEIIRLFAFKSAEAAFRLLHEANLMQVLLPELVEYLDACEGDPLIWQYLAGLDTGGLPKRKYTSEMCLSVLFCAPAMAALRAAGIDPISGDRGRIVDGVRTYLRPIGQRLKIPKRIVDRMVCVIGGQYRFTARPSRRSSKARFMAQEYFREMLTLFTVRVRVTGKDEDHLERWRELYANSATRSKSKPSSSSSSEKKKSSSRTSSRRRRRKRASGRLAAVTTTLPADAVTANQKGTESVPEPAASKTPTTSPRTRKLTKPSQRNGASVLPKSAPADTPLTGVDFYLESASEDVAPAASPKRNSRAKRRDADRPEPPREPVQRHDDADEEPHWMDEI